MPRAVVHYRIKLGPSVSGRDRLYWIRDNTIIKVWTLPRWCSFLSRRWEV